MASTRAEFVSRIVLRAVVFISLSVAASAAELRRCYWCGPLAEQVHRSQRAPQCRGPTTHVTICDEGYPHCAIVATSPPHVESRYCVKFYQDECYSTFCNSTKTWRMTCPCRGDLCNGPNAEREEQAFTYLAKLVAKHSARIKRASPSEFINKDSRNQIESSTSIPIKTTLTSNVTETVGNLEVKSIQNGMNITDMKDDETMQKLSNNTIMESDKEMQSDQPSRIVETEPNNNTDSNENMGSLPTTQASIKAEVNEATTAMITKITVPIPSKVKISNKDIKPSEQMPPAEALQHNETPLDKVTEKTTMDTTAVMSTHSALTTEKTMARNNTAAQINKNVFILAIGIILIY